MKCLLRPIGARWYSKAEKSRGSRSRIPAKPAPVSGADLIDSYSSDFQNHDARNWRESFLGKSEIEDKSDFTKALEPKSRRNMKGTRKSRILKKAEHSDTKSKSHKSESKEKVNGQDYFTHAPSSHVYNISSSDINYSQYKVPGQPPVPPLANNLDRVLFSPGVHFLKDPRSNVYNFPPSLENIMSIRDFDFDKVPHFVPSGKDSKLATLAQQEGKKYTGSTSSITGTLFHLHQALSHHRPPSLMGLSKYFGGRTTTFTNAQKMPSAFLLKYNENTNTYAIAPLPSDAGSESILSLLGHAMETMLVTESAEFANYDREKSHLLPPNKQYLSTYNYLSSGPFLLRSQLDCFDERLPGTGFFDLKTRACCAVRHDIDYAQIRDGCTYQIIKRDGYEESYSREFYELIRTALFKYSLQARIGSMDGIFVAYHNINTLFGFEYLPLPDIDAIFHTSHLVMEQRGLPSDMHEKVSRTGTLVAEKEFALSLGVLEKILDKIVATKPKTSFKVFLESPSPRALRLVYTECDHPESVEANVEIGDEALKLETGGPANDKVDAHHQNKPSSNRSYGLRVVVTSAVNGVKVPSKSHPHIENESDCWEVVCDMEEMSSREASKTLKEILDLYKPQVLKTVPKTNRDGETEDQESAIKQLEVPTAFQERLRELQKRGKEYIERNEKREKITWIPRT